MIPFLYYLYGIERYPYEMYTTNIALKHSYDLVTRDDKTFQPFPKKLTSGPEIEARKLLEPKAPKVGPRGISDQRKKQIQGKLMSRKICVETNPIRY